MDNTLRITDHITIGGQPSEDQLRRLGELGFRSIVNFRHAGEDDQPLSPEREGTCVQALGLQYLHVPVSMKTLCPETVDDFRRRFAQLPTPAFAHCKAGMRAAAMVLMYVGCEQGLSGDECLKLAQEKGIDCNHPLLSEFVKHYMDQRTGGVGSTGGSR